jgi:hypothetical protein
VSTAERLSPADVAPADVAPAVTETTEGARGGMTTVFTGRAGTADAATATADAEAITSLSSPTSDVWESSSGI